MTSASQGGRMKPTIGCSISAAIAVKGAPPLYRWQPSAGTQRACVVGCGWLFLFRKQLGKCKGHQRPPRMFSKFRFVPAGDAESEIAFSKKDETFQQSQGILSPLRLPVPPRPHY